MKSFGALLILLTLVGCDPYGFGFKKNPAYVLDEAFKAISNLDTETFLEMTGKEALCIYGTPAGVAYLKENVKLTPENVKLKPTVLQNRHFTGPKFVGYWSYYHERYQIDIHDKISNEVLLKTIVDCEYGIDGEKADKYINMKPKKYKKKECRVSKVLPKTFAELPLPSKCEDLRVNL
jgi:hypothetical protein